MKSDGESYKTHRQYYGNMSSRQSRALVLIIENVTEYQEEQVQREPYRVDFGLHAHRSQSSGTGLLKAGKRKGVTLLKCFQLGFAVDDCFIVI